MLKNDSVTSPEPLKNKLSWECIGGGESEVFYKEDIKSAVEWLKAELAFRNHPVDFPYERIRNKVERKIDIAFEDVMK